MIIYTDDSGNRDKLEIVVKPDLENEDGSKPGIFFTITNLNVQTSNSIYASFLIDSESAKQFANALLDAAKKIEEKEHDN